MKRSWKQWFCGLRLHKRPFKRRLRTFTVKEWPYKGLTTTHVEDFCSHCGAVLLRLELPHNDLADLVQEYYKDR